MTVFRRVLKAAVETSLCRTGVAGVARRRHAADTMILAYHNIVPDGLTVTGDRSLHLAQRDFARQLDLLRRTHEVVPLSALTEPRRTAARPRAVITFDDAYQGALTAGLEELALRGLTATVFVAPAFVGGGTFWWDALAGAAEESDVDVRRHALDQLHGRDPSVRGWAADRGLHLEAGPPHQACASEAQLRATAGAGITLASHSWSHSVLPALQHDDLERELTAPRAWLAERFTNVVDWLAYPYGLHSPAVAAAARDIGYEGALLVDGGWAAPDRAPDPARFTMPRRNIPAGVSLAGFELRAAGLTG